MGSDSRQSQFQSGAQQRQSKVGEKLLRVRTPELQQAVKKQVDAYTHDAVEVNCNSGNHPPAWGNSAASQADEESIVYKIIFLARQPTCR